MSLPFTTLAANPTALVVPGDADEAAALASDLLAAYHASERTSDQWNATGLLLARIATTYPQHDGIHQIVATWAQVGNPHHFPTPAIINAYKPYLTERGILKAE